MHPHPHKRGRKGNGYIRIASVRRGKLGISKDTWGGRRGGGVRWEMGGGCKRGATLESMRSYWLRGDLGIC